MMIDGNRQGIKEKVRVNELKKYRVSFPRKRESRNLLDSPPTFIFMLLVTFLALFPSASIAQAKPSPVLANAVDVALVYATLADEKPDFERLLSIDPTFQGLSSFEKMRMRTPRIDALTAAFAKVSPTTMPLVVRAPVRVSVSTTPPALVLGYRSEHLPYFPFWDGTRFLTLYTEDLPLLSILPVADDLALRRAGYLIDDGTALYLDLLPGLRPPREPTEIDNVSQILIPTRIARARLVNTGGDLVWSWVNPRHAYLYPRGIE